MIDWNAIDFLVVFGLDAEIYSKALFWLDDDSKRRLVFISEDVDALKDFRKSVDAMLLLADPRVQIHSIETPIQLDSMMKQIAWRAVFLKLGIVECEGGSRYFEEGKLRLNHYHLGADLLLSDAADCGLSIFQNIHSRRKTSSRSALGLKGAFHNLPAIIVGAGPSLKKNKRYLESLSDKALILAGGTALNSLDFAPHFAASVDSKAPYAQFKRAPFWEVPFCFQSRMNPDNFSLIHGESLWAPEGHFSALNWLEGEESSFDGGWTVGNFLTGLAALWGCDPIIFVGMDFCYDGDEKYNDITPMWQEGLHFAEGVWTQRDWLMARQWTQELNNRYPDKLFINATEGGMGLSEPIQTCRLEQINLRVNNHLKQIVHQKIQELPLLSSREERWTEWRQSLSRSAAFCQHQLDSDDFDLSSLNQELVCEKFLAPLWNVWRPIFERELDLDPHPLSREKKVKLNQILFFQQVIERQMNVLK